MYLKLITDSITKASDSIGSSCMQNGWVSSL